MKIIPCVMIWEGMVTKYHKIYKEDIRLDRPIEAYIHFKLLKMFLERLMLESRRGIHTSKKGDIEVGWKSAEISNIAKKSGFSSLEQRTQI